MDNPAASVPCLTLNMGRSANYISPAKKMRNLSRLAFYLKQKLIDTEQKTIKPKLTLSITNLSSTSISPNESQSSLSTSTTFTSFPLPCQVCDLNQCKLDLAHQLSFAVSKSMDKAFDEFYGRKKPPEEM